MAGQIEEFVVIKLKVQPVYNADGTHNSAGRIEEFVIVELKVQDHSEQIVLAVTNLGTNTVFLGHDWLKLHNPLIDWKYGAITFQCQDDHVPDLISTDDEEEEEEKEQICFQNGERLFQLNVDTWIQNTSTDITATANQQKPKKTFKEIAPHHYHDYEDVFAKENFDELPLRRPWDHAIKLLSGEHIIDCKTYNLSPNEQKELNVFLEENLQSGRICPSKSPFASPFFFVKKNDGHLFPVQDYQKLNAIMVKNRYPLPLISELIDKLKTAKYIYAPNSPHAHTNFWSQIQNKITLAANRPDILLGDFNIVEDAIDRAPFHKDYEPAVYCLRDLHNAPDLHDTWHLENPMECSHTFTSNTNSLSRLNRIYVQAPLQNSFYNWKTTSTSIPTNHKAVLVCFVPQKTPFLGKGHWTWPLSLLYNHQLLQAITNDRIELQSKLTNLPDPPKYHAQQAWKAFKNCITTLAKQTAKMNLFKMDSHIASLKSKITTLEQNPNLDNNDSVRTSISTLECELHAIHWKRYKNAYTKAQALSSFQIRSVKR